MCFPRDRVTLLARDSFGGESLDLVICFVYKQISLLSNRILTNEILQIRLDNELFSKKGDFKISIGSLLKFEEDAVLFGKIRVCVIFRGYSGTKVSLLLILN